MKYLGLIFASALLSACGVIECVDSQFEREPVNINGESLFEITFSNGELKSHAIKCEKYYDSMCAERGNSWRIREVGKSGEHKRSYLPIPSESGSSYELELPNCEKIIRLNSQITMKDIAIVWNKDASKTESTELGKVTSWLGKSYHYVSSENGVHNFKYGGYRDVPLEELKLEFTLKLNGKTIE
ncbi:hypothetical protein [Pseudoalteromonas sp. NBT06-2]|uniref:hypothetical protein n=1 Tax=Pseudoalteromonas sp. NBT06-2 TaxID=2025950 RepID=UPI001140CC0C|nr:hypothetical protein [Pseudoalteromonas sp. NBT06-2]